MSAILAAISFAQILPPIMAAGAAAFGLNMAVKSVEKTAEMVNSADDHFEIDQDLLNNFRASDDWLDDGREQAEREDENLYELWYYSNVWEHKVASDFEWARYRYLKEKYGEDFSFSDEQNENYSSRFGKEAGSSD